MSTPAITPASSERQKMLAGELYDGFDADLLQERYHARRLLHAHNNSGAEEVAHRADLLSELFGRPAENGWIEPPFFCDYGHNIFLGRVMRELSTIGLNDEGRLGHG